MNVGRLVRINVSQGGVPKHPIPSARIGRGGVEGDRQRDLRYHGGPERAVSLWSLEVLEALGAEGHPIAAGAAGENLTVAGLDWAAVAPGARLAIGPVRLQVTGYADPCEKVAGCFAGGRFQRISQKLRPGWSRVYARVLSEGRVAEGDPVALEAAAGA
ncbi:MAG TPA: MOSC domain-containing protein [Anaeromyxobacter sp.]|nr:MOSC domain-containing protein [Anaeromyxobacter sp.]